MKDILTAPFVEEMKRATANMYRLGWDERNGGNISYMLEESVVQKCVFEFTNTGDKPLTVSQAHASCGCTVPQFSKAPIPPGGKGKIYVTYNGKGRAGGQFRKVITVVSSASNSLARIYVEGTIEIED